jgi:membrane-associated phospholipid phosphatase
MSGPVTLSWPGSSSTSIALLIALFLLIMVLQWSRVKLNMHTPSQVVAGTLLAIILTTLQLTFLVPVTETLLKV